MKSAIELILSHYKILLIELFLNICHVLKVSSTKRTIHSRVFNQSLKSEILKIIDRSLKVGDCEESSQVGSVLSDDDEAEHPPGGSKEPSSRTFRSLSSSLRCDGAAAEPKSLSNVEISLFIIILIVFFIVLVTVWRISIKIKSYN